MTVAHTIEEAETLNAKLASLDLAERLSFVAGLGGRVVFTTSLGIEDQVITISAVTSRSRPISTPMPPNTA
jgi:phosphoadenosine phosphosulfate reductase